MAAWRFETKVISRGKGGHAVAAAAYRARARLACEDGRARDYRHRGGDLAHTELLLPSAAPAAVRDRADLWNAVERAERRRDARLAREFQLGLPRELPPDVAHRLVLDWARRELVERHGVAVDVAVHAPRARDGGENRHAHLLATDRPVTAAGLGPAKVRSWNRRDVLAAWRASWAAACNAALEAIGAEARVSHRSNAARAVPVPAEPKVGHRTWGMDRRGAVAERHERAMAVRELRHATAELAALEAAQLAARAGEAPGANPRSENASPTPSGHAAESPAAARLRARRRAAGLVPPDAAGPPAAAPVVAPPGTEATTPNRPRAAVDPRMIGLMGARDAAELHRRRSGPGVRAPRPPPPLGSAPRDRTERGDGGVAKLRDMRELRRRAARDPLPPPPPDGARRALMAPAARHPHEGRDALARARAAWAAHQATRPGALRLRRLLGDHRAERWAAEEARLRAACARAEAGEFAARAAHDERRRWLDSPEGRGAVVDAVEAARLRAELDALRRRGAGLEIAALEAALAKAHGLPLSADPPGATPENALGPG